MSLPPPPCQVMRFNGCEWFSQDVAFVNLLIKLVCAIRGFFTWSPKVRLHAKDVGFCCSVVSPPGQQCCTMNGITCHLTPGWRNLRLFKQQWLSHRGLLLIRHRARPDLVLYKNLNRSDHILHIVLSFTQLSQPPAHLRLRRIQIQTWTSMEHGRFTPRRTTRSSSRPWVRTNTRATIHYLL